MLAPVTALHSVGGYLLVAMGNTLELHFKQVGGRLGGGKVGGCLGGGGRGNRSCTSSRWGVGCRPRARGGEWAPLSMLHNAEHNMACHVGLGQGRSLCYATPNT
jgi:hypothetical protein